MTSFRSFLARERLVPVEQLDRALQRQILYGEDLAVNLLEMGAVEEEELAQFLGMFHRLPIVTRSDLESVPASILARVPAALALRHRVCPVAMADETMVVAASRQLDRATLDELRRATGTNVSLAVATPVALARALHLHYGAEMPPRFQRLADRQAKRASAPPEPGATPPADSVRPTEEEPVHPRRPSGVIVMPDDLPESAQPATTAPAEIPSTPEASMPPPVPAPAEPTAAEPAPPPEETATSSVAEHVLRGVSLSHDNPADRLLEMVLGPPSQPPAPPAATEERAEADVTTEPGVPPPALPPADVPEGTAAPFPRIAPMPGVSPPPPPAPVAEEEPAAAVVRVPSVMLGTAQEEPPAERRARPGTIPPVVEAILRSAPVAPGPRSDLVGRIQKLDALGTPTEVLRYAFQLFSAAFRVGVLFDTTTRNPRLRDAFGVRSGVEGYRGRELPEEVVPSPVRNAGQPLLAPLESEGALAQLLRELFGDLPVNGLFLPVTVGPRVVAVLYGDNRDAATSFDSVRDLFHLAWAAGTRLGELVRRRRRVGPADTAPDVDVEDTERGMPPGPTTT